MEQSIYDIVENAFYSLLQAGGGNSETIERAADDLVEALASAGFIELAEEPLTPEPNPPTRA